MTDPLDVAEFKRILDIGLGRAVIYLQNHDATPYRDAILNACLHNTAYDRQVEGTRAEYMLDVVRLTGETEYYREHVLNALSTHEYEDWDVQQQIMFATILAGEGDERARQAVYDTVVRHMNDELLGSVLINLDGMEGLAFILERLAETQSKPSFSGFDTEYLIGVLEDREGIKQAQRKLKQYSASNPHVASLVQAGFDARERRKQARRKRPHPAKYSYQDVKLWMENPDTLKSPPISWVVWGKYASEEDLVQAARDLLQVADNETQRILAYVQIFRHRCFPLAPDRLIEWAKLIGGKPILQPDGSFDPEARISYLVLSSLSLYAHAEVRALALWMIEQSKQAGRAVGLLAANYQQGDWQLIKSLTRQNLNNENYHSLGFSVEGVFKQHPSTDAISALLDVYEYGPCSNCRRRFVECLDSLDAVPAWMLDECKYDANHDLRQLARNNFQHPAK